MPAITRANRLRSLLLVAVTLVPIVSAWGACPDNLCDCLGAAGTFSVLASGRMKAKTSKVSVSGSPYQVPMEILGDACMTLGQFGGDSDVPAETGLLAFLFAGPGPAVKFQAKKFYGVLEPGVYVHGDVATAGGTILGLAATIIDGTPDTTGSHPSVGRCQQGAAAVGSASAALAALTPTVTLGKLIVKGGSGTPYVITAGPGVTVATAERITVKAARVDGYPDGSEIDIETDSATQAFIINTPKLAVGKLSTITATDPTKVIINVTGPGGRVAIDNNASIDVAVVAKDRKITVGANATTGNLYGKDVQVKGGSVAPTLYCSPSGAFVDRDTAAP